MSEAGVRLRKWPSPEAPVITLGSEKKGEVLEVKDTYEENWVRLKSSTQVSSGWINLSEGGFDLDERLELRISHPEKFDIQLCVVRVDKDVKVSEAKRMICQVTGLREDSLVLVKRIKVDTSTLLTGTHIKKIIYNWSPAGQDETVADLGYNNGDKIALTYLTSAEDDLHDNLKGLLPADESDDEQEDLYFSKSMSIQVHKGTYSA